MKDDFFLTALGDNSSHIIPFIHLKCTVHWGLVGMAFFLKSEWVVASNALKEKKRGIGLVVGSEVSLNC